MQNVAQLTPETCYIWFNILSILIWQIILQTQEDYKCVNIVRQINTTCATFVIKKVQRSWCINQILAHSIGIYSDWVYLSDLSNSIFADTFFNAVDRFVFLMLGMSKFCARSIWVILIQILLSINCLGKAQYLKPPSSRTKILHVQLCIFGCWLSFHLISRFIVLA